MQDLDAPLTPPTAARGAGKSVGNTGGKLPLHRKAPWLAPAAALSVLVIAVNAVALLSRDPYLADTPRAVTDTVETGTVPLQRDAAGSTETATSGTQVENGVQIIYGNETSSRSTALLDEGAEAPVPTPRPETRERRLSDDGPKIITVRDPSAARVGQSLQLAHLPDPDAIEETEAGSLPVRTSDGRRPMDIYARPWATTGGRRIALVIGGLGLSQTGTKRALELLPADITLAFAPQGNSLGRWMKVARKKGHELLLQVPMEPFGYPEIDPGPHTLRLASSPQTNLENLHWAMSRLSNYTGIVNYLGGRMATDEQAMSPILGDLAYRGLLFLNDGTAGSALSEYARRTGVPYGEADLVIDASHSRADILAKLQELERRAASNGYAIGTGSALGLTVETVAEWANEAKKRGFEFVGISAIVQTAGQAR